MVGDVSLDSLWAAVKSTRDTFALIYSNVLDGLIACNLYTAKVWREAVVVVVVVVVYVH